MAWVKVGVNRRQNNTNRAVRVRVQVIVSLKLDQGFEMGRRRIEARVGYLYSTAVCPGMSVLRHLGFHWVCLPQADTDCGGTVQMQNDDVDSGRWELPPNYSE